MKFKLYESVLQKINNDQLKLDLQKELGKSHPNIKIDVFNENKSSTGSEALNISISNDAPFFDALIVVSKQRDSELIDIDISGKINKKYDFKHITKKTISGKQTVEDMYDIVSRAAVAVTSGLARTSPIAAAHVNVKEIIKKLSERIKFDLTSAFPRVVVSHEPIEKGYEIQITSDKPFLDIYVSVVHDDSNEKVHIKVAGKISPDENYKSLNFQSISSMNTTEDILAYAIKTFFIGYAAYIKVQKNRDKKSRQSNIKMY